jgi:hypothetical protein
MTLVSSGPVTSSVPVVPLALSFHVPLDPVSR